MTEFALIALTIGALLFHSIELSLSTIALISVLCAVGFSLCVPTRKGLLAGVLIASIVFIGALTLWSRMAVVEPALFGKRTFEAVTIASDRKLDRTVLIVKDSVYGQRIRIVYYGAFMALPGDTLRIAGAVEEPKDFAGDTGRVFAYGEYLQSKGIVAVMQNPAITVLSTGRGSIARTASVVRYALADRFTHFISFPTDGIVAGMLLGYQGGIPQSVEELFRRTGVLHVLVLSGYNITLLGGALGIVLRRLPARLRTALTFTAIVGLVLISGSGIASIRAGVMGSIALFATLSLENYNALRALCVSYALFFFWSPTTIFSDPGFHLSFLATLCMIAVIPKAENLFSFIPKTEHVDVRALVMLAVLMPLFMLPYTMYFSGIAPLSSVPANILFALITPFILSLGVMILIFSVFPPIASILGAVVSFIGTRTLDLLEFFNTLPVYMTPLLPWWGVVGIYSVFFITVFRSELRAFTVRLQNAFRRHPNSYVR